MIIYELDGGMNDITNPISYVAGSKFLFADATKTGYSFAGWFDAKGTKITGIEAETKGNITLTARWTANKNTLTVSSEDTTKGTVLVKSGSGYSGENIIVEANPKDEYKFEGWYYNDVKVSTDKTYTFKMPTNDYSLVAKFVYDEEY